MFGTFTTDQVIGYGETAIAEAARPALGDGGFTIMAIALVLYTSCCTNATLYASGNLTDQLRKAELFPESFGETTRLGLLAIELDAIVRQKRRTRIPPERHTSPTTTG